MARNKLRTSICFALMTMIGGAAASAETPEEKALRLEREIGELRAAVAELQNASTDEERLSEIERRLGILAEEVENLKVGEALPTAVGGETIPGLAPAAAKVYRTDHGLSVGGYGEALVEVFDDSRDDGSDSGKTDTFDLLRAILYFGYKFDDRFVFTWVRREISPATRLAAMTPR